MSDQDPSRSHEHKLKKSKHHHKKKNKQKEASSPPRQTLRYTEDKSDRKYGLKDSDISSDREHSRYEKGPSKYSEMSHQCHTDRKPADRYKGDSNARDCGKYRDDDKHDRDSRDYRKRSQDHRTTHTHNNHDGSTHESRKRSQDHRTTHTHSNHDGSTHESRKRSQDHRTTHTHSNHDGSTHESRKRSQDHRTTHTHSNHDGSTHESRKRSQDHRTTHTHSNHDGSTHESRKRSQDHRTTHTHSNHDGSTHESRKRSQDHRTTHTHSNHDESTGESRTRSDDNDILSSQEYKFSGKRCDDHKTHTSHRNFSRERRKSPTSSAEERTSSHKRHCSPPSGSVERSHRKRRPSTESVEDTTELPDYEFEWERHRYTLNRIFFTDDDPIRRNTKEYDDFWAFVEKYKNFQRKKAVKKIVEGAAPSMDSSGSKLDLPKKYDKRYRINISIPPRDVNTFLKESRGDPQALTKDRANQLKQILLHYLDFDQKQKLSKLVKIRRDQENLPIFQYRDQIIEGVKSYPIVVIAGDTGCGKSTQVPQYLLQAGFETIACTQPRRIACISLSKRVSYETLNEYGSQVAYQVRFEKSRTKATRILFLTEGLLLRQMCSEPLLPMYSVLLLDEVHERHIHTDFLLGVLKAVMAQRPDLKLVLMSATINISLFSDYFDQAPVIQVPGRLYPIQLQYCPIPPEEQSGKSERLDPGPYLRVLQTIDKKYPINERGDVLIFLSGMAEIMSVVEAMQAYAQQTHNWIILPLHSALSVSEQDKVFGVSPEGVRKVIVSTNIAETSVTIDGVRFVVDSGKVKEMSFDPKYKMRRLREFWISQASAEQRKGRAGRTGPGVCYRLYNDSDYNSLQAYSTPEIQRVPLDSLILQMASMGLPDARMFPFIEPPAASSIENSIICLKEQGALTEQETLTPIGEMLAQLPVDVVIGKMLIMGAIFHMVDPVLTIAACLSVQSPFTSRAHTDYDAMNTRKPLESDHGDPFTLLNAFDEWIQIKAANQASRKWCRRRGLEEQRFYEVVKLKRQFKELLTDHGLLDNLPEDYRNLTKQQRLQMHASRKQLRGLKRDQQMAGVKRKVLKLDQDAFQLETGDDVEDAPDLDSDIKDLEFRLTHDLDQLQERSSSSRTLTFRDLSLLKVILCSGLYPQVAIADEHNGFKKDSEQVFHTRSKPFVLLHPTSILANHMDVLELQERDIVETPQSNERKVFSSKHQLVTFVSLLETTKPYLMGTMRVPALQVLTLYATAIDTNTDCTRFLCDGWLEVVFQNGEDGVTVLSSVVQLRTTWTKLIQIKLQAKKQGGIVDPGEGVKGRQLERLLAKKLSEFLASNIVYTLRRVLATEAGHAYKGPENADSESVSELLGDLCRNAKPHPSKGGMQINDYITFNCLVDDDSAYGGYTTYLQNHWTCSNCGQQLVVSVVERLQHEQDCLSTESPEATAAAEKQRLTASIGHLRKDYHCPNCDQDFVFTATEILKHRKQCKPPQG